MKKKLVLGLAAAMSISLLAGCGGTAEKPQDAAPAQTEAVEEAAPATEQAEAPVEETKDPMDLSDSRYFFAYTVEGLGDMVAYFHFYGNDLGIGNVFYAGYAWNQIAFSGTYIVEEAAIDYTVKTEKGDDAEDLTGTAPYTVTFFDWDGNEIDKAGYDGEFFYNITTAINTDPMTGGGLYRMSCATAEDIEKYADSFDGELGIPYLKMVDPADASAYVTLNTNGSYEDMVIFAIEGTWAQTADGEYTLTPASESDNGATLTLQEDGTYKYVSTAGDEAVLAAGNGPEAGFVFAGKIPVAGMEADLVLTTYTDGTCKVVAAMAGMELEVDNGTYEVAENGYEYTFQFDKAGEIKSELGGETGVQVNYVQAGAESIGDIDAMLGVVLE